MAKLDDVVAYVLQRKPGVGEKKLQKLLYYAQARTAAWIGCPLFDARIEAWVQGPVVRDVWVRRKHYYDGDWPAGDSAQLTAVERACVDAVLDEYGDKTGNALETLSHSEVPYREARGDIAPTQRSKDEIAVASMRRFYPSTPPHEVKASMSRDLDALQRPPKLGRRAWEHLQRLVREDA